MTSIFPQRMTSVMEGDFCVFLIGMRINRPWKIHRWWPVTTAMPRMIKELSQRPELGLLSAETWFGRTTVMIQYWRSFEQLERYARDPDLQHLPAWAAFSKLVGNSGDVGIWHETYRISAGQYESIYHNMPAFGLGKVGQLVTATGKRESAGQRMTGS